jgi:hypothetical protein
MREHEALRAAIKDLVPPQENIKPVKSIYGNSLIGLLAEAVVKGYNKLKANIWGFIMDISLRRARRLEMALRNITVPNQSVQVRAYDIEVAKLDLEAGVTAVQYSIEDTLDLNDIRFDIRNKINRKNVVCGISDMLNLRDSLHEQRRILESIKAPDDSEVQLKYLRKMNSHTVSLTVIRQEHLEYVKDILRGISRQLDDISDDLNQLNSAEMIPLSDEDLKLLSDKGLI